MPPLQDSENKTGLLERSISGGKWLTIGSIAQKTIGFISFLVLARLLPPTEFGIIALVLLVPKFIEAATDTGLGAAVLQRKGDIHPYLNPIWTIGIIKSIIIALLTWFLGPAIAAFYHAESAALAIRLGGLFFVVYNLSNIGETYLFRELDFKKIVWRNVSRDAAYAAVSIIIAVFYPSYWALFFGTLASYIVQTAATYLIQPYRPKFSLNISALKELLSYGKWIIGQGWTAQLYAFLETSIVARWNMPADLGYFSKAKNMASTLPGFLGPMISRVSFSAYAKLQEETDKIADGIIKTCHLIFFFLIPATAVIFFAGGKIILFLLGQAWLPMTNPLRWLLVYYLLLSISDVAQPLLNATGRPGKQLAVDATRSGLTIILLFFFTKWYGIAGSAAALFFGVLPSTVLNLRLMTRVAKLSLGRLLHTALVPTAISLLALLPIIVWKDAILSLPALLLTLVGFGYGAAYLLLTYLVGRMWKMGSYQTLRLIWKHVF